MKKTEDNDFKNLPFKKEAQGYFFMVRVLDIVLSICAIIILLPVYFIIAAAIYIEDTHNPIYISMRLGKNMKPFRFIKFRSMVHNAWELERKNKEIMSQLRGGKHKVENHPLVTKVGKFIRKTSLDESIQFINVLKGDMSVVGPRAQYQDEVDKFLKESPDHKKYIDAFYEVKPGITGFWQISGRNKIDYDKRMRMEATYARTYSILNYLTILLKTPRAVIKAETH